MRTKFYLAGMLILIICIASCKKDTEGEYESTNEYLEAHKKESHVFSFSPNDTFNFTSPVGTEFTFYGGSFERLDHGTISGNINVELKEYYSRADFIFEDFGTSTGDQLLESGGYFFIQTTNNGVIVRGKIGVKIAAENINPNMQVFLARTDSLPLIWYPSWNPNDTVYSRIYEDSTYYYMEYFNVYEWVNCDDFIEGPRSDFSVHVTKSPSSNNTRVLFVFDSINSVASFENLGDYNFHLDYLPVDYTGKLFAFVVYQGHTYYYLENMTITSVVDKEIEMIITTPSELTSIISNL